MRKVLLIILSLLLFFPLTMHSSDAYFTDSESIGVSISAAEDSPYFVIELLSEGAQSFDPPISSGSNNTFRVDWYKSKEREYGKSGVGIGTVISHIPDIAIRIEFVIAEGDNFFTVKQINNLTGDTNLEISRKNEDFVGDFLTVNFQVYDNHGRVLLAESFPIYVHP